MQTHIIMKVMSVRLWCLIGIGIALLTKGSASAGSAINNATCSLPRGTPPLFRSTCTLTTITDVEPGGRLEIASPGLRLQGVEPAWPSGVFGS